MGIWDGVREGAADLFGFRNELDDLRESAADAKLLARRAEDLGWDLLNSDARYKEPRNEVRKDKVERAYKYYYDDGIVAQSVNLVTWYTFGRGMGKPRYRAEGGNAAAGGDSEQQAANRLISAFWQDEDNQRTLTTAQAQEQKSTELQLQGNVYFLLFPSAEPGGAAPPASSDVPAGGERLSSISGAEPDVASTLKVSDLPEHEIVDIIMNPENRKVPVFYKRQYTPRTYDFASKTYIPAGQTKTIYYRDWKHQAPTEVQGPDGKMIPWGPKDDEIGEGLVYHVAVNRVSDTKFGQSEIARVLPWAAGLRSYMTDRMAVVQAIAKIALQVKTKGGAKQVNQIAEQLADISNLAGQIEGSGQTRRIADTEKTKVAFMNQGTSLEPMVTDTGASSSATDIQTMLGMASAASGIPPHYYGQPGSASLATATAMELPVLKMMEARQELWESVYRDIMGWMLKRSGYDPERLEVTMPGILQRDVGTTISSLAALVTAVDPQVQNKELIRYVVGEALETMGKQNVEEVLERLFPENWTPPAAEKHQQELEQGDATIEQTKVQTQTTANPPAPPAPAGATPEGQRRNVAAAVRRTALQATTADAKRRNGTDRAPSDRGGTSSSQRASSARQARAAGSVGQSQTLIRQADVEGEGWEEQGVLPLLEAPASRNTLPPELAGVAEEAMTAVEDLAAGIFSELGLENGSSD